MSHPQHPRRLRLAGDRRLSIRRYPALSLSYTAEERALQEIRQALHLTTKERAPVSVFGGLVMTVGGGGISGMETTRLVRGDAVEQQ